MNRVTEIYGFMVMSPLNEVAEVIGHGLEYNERFEMIIQSFKQRRMFDQSPNYDTVAVSSAFREYLKQHGLVGDIVSVRRIW